jgi:hypothetical protein
MLLSRDLRQACHMLAQLLDDRNGLGMAERNGILRQRERVEHLFRLKSSLDDQKRDHLMETSEHRAGHLHRIVGGGRWIFVAHFAFLNFTPGSPPLVNSTPAASSVIRMSFKAGRLGIASRARSGRSWASQGRWQPRRHPATSREAAAPL